MIEIIKDTGYVAVFAFDPGDSTGVCYLGTYAGKCVFYTATFGQPEVHKFIGDREAHGGGGLVIYEDFVSRATFVSRKQIAPQIIGALRFWVYKNKDKDMKVTPAETHKLDRKDLKKAGWSWESEHELDAIRILVCALLKIKYAKG
jgi:hypothetical protein